MPANLVNRHDVLHVISMLRRGKWRSVLHRLLRTGDRRVRDAWVSPVESPDQWWVIDAVRARWARMILDTASEDFPGQVVRKYLAGRSELRALSVGCGTGHRALRWARTGVFGRIDAVDLSPPLIEAGRRAAAEQTLQHLVHFEVGDVRRAALPDEAYDVAFAEQSLHHFSPLEAALGRVRDALAPGGLLVVDEYVGPNRNQWTVGQLDAANALLATLPVRYRVTPEGDVKRRVVRPSLLRMRLHDPSEAVESARIMPLLRAMFRVEDERGYGGALLHPLLARIAQNFRGEDEETRTLLGRCFDAEDALLGTGEIGHDFAVAVCRKT